MSANSSVNFGRNQVDGFAISQNIFLGAVLTRFISYVLPETTHSSESMERYVNCTTSSWSVVCFTRCDKFVVYVANRSQLVIGSSLGPRGWIVKALAIQETKKVSDSSPLCKLACQYQLSHKCLQYFLEVFVAPKNSRMSMSARISVTIVLYRNHGFLV